MNDSIMTRMAVKRDSDEIACIYNQGIEDRIATFETAFRKAGDIDLWLDSAHPVVVGTMDDRVVSFAASFPYSNRACYAGVSEFSIYVHRNYRKRGIGKPTLERLILECRSRGTWKLVSRVFPENNASRKMLKSIGFREVGIYEKHGKLDGEWKDTVIVEYIINENIA